MKKINENYFTSVVTNIKRYVSMSKYLIDISTLLLIVLLYFVLSNKIEFNSDNLRDLTNFILTTIIALSAMGFTIFSLPIKNNNSDKDKIIFGYIGHTIFLVSYCMLSYIVSCLNFPSITVSIYFCFTLFMLCRCITRTLLCLILYFNNFE